MKNLSDFPPMMVNVLSLSSADSPAAYLENEKSFGFSTHEKAILSEASWASSLSFSDSPTAYLENEKSFGFSTHERGTTYDKDAH